MLFYVLTIGITDVLMIVVNLLLNKQLFNMSILYIVLAALLGTVAVIAIDGVLAFAIRRLPGKWFSKDVKIYSTPKAEMHFYEKLGIKKWKDHILELGNFTDFHKDKITDPHNPAYIERFILENNYGAVIHLSNVILGWLVIFCFPLRYFWCFGFPIAFVNSFLSLLPYMILRYNTPKLLTLYQILLKKQQAKTAN